MFVQLSSDFHKQTKKGLVWFGLAWLGLVWLNHVGCVLLSWFGLIKFSSVNFILFGSVRIFTNKQKNKKNENGLKYRVAAQLKT